jgi:hypothetical protein
MCRLATLGERFQRLKVRGWMALRGGRQQVSTVENAPLLPVVHFRRRVSTVESAKIPYVGADRGASILYGVKTRIYVGYVNARVKARIMAPKMRAMQVYEH